MIETHLVLNEYNEHEYNIVVKEIEPKVFSYSLLASDNSIWTNHIKGTELMSFVDNGNEIIIEGFDSITLNKTGKKIDYDVAMEFLLLLNFRNKTVEKQKYKIINEKDLIEI